MRLVTTTGRLESLFGIEKAIDIIADAGFDALDLSAHADSRHYNGEYDKNFYLEIKKYAEEYDIKIAVENMWQMPRCNQIGHSTCSRPDEFIRYVDELNNDSIIGCLDIGHASLVCEDADAFIRKLGGKRLKCLHTHDVNVNDDSHTLPFFGITNWDLVMKALSDIGYDGELTYEADSFMAKLPPQLHPDAEKYMERTGRYLINKFESYK